MAVSDSDECLINHKITGVGFTTDESNNSGRHAVFDAIIDAQNRAHDYAKEIGCSAGNILSIRQDHDDPRILLKHDATNKELTISGIPRGQLVEVNIVMLIHCC
jgi:uncharacterized protein YggE